MLLPHPFIAAIIFDICHFFQKQRAPRFCSVICTARSRFAKTSPPAAYAASSSVAPSHILAGELLFVRQQCGDFFEHRQIRQELLLIIFSLFEIDDNTFDLFNG